MNRDEFDKLPTAMQVRVLARVVFGGEKITAIELGRSPLPPKFDARIYRRGKSFQWASETDLEGLRFWHNRAKEGAAKGGEWAAKDEKRARDLERWLNWREWFPDAVWSGERDRRRVTAAMPSGKPELQEFDSPRSNASESSGGAYSDDDYGAASSDDEYGF